MKIEFEYSLDEYRLFDEHEISEWIALSIQAEKKIPGEVFFHFVTEDEILSINRDYLNHNYFTDIITFDDVFVNIINGDIFISPDTVKSNSQELNYPFLKELKRVIIHGIMHLCGYRDASEEEKCNMRSLEDKYLSYLEKI